MRRIFVVIQVIVIVCVSSNCIQSGRCYYEGYIYAYEGNDIYVYKKYIDNYIGDINALKGYIDTIEDQNMIQNLRYNNRIEGYIYVVKEKPLQGLRVYPRDCQYFRCTAADSAGGVTDENGYFKFRQAKQWSTIYLMIESEGKDIDSVQVSFIMPYNGKHYKHFCDGRTDTLWLYTPEQYKNQPHR